MHTALSIFQPQKYQFLREDWIYEAPGRVALSNQFLQSQIFLRQCAEQHLHKLVLYLERLEE